MKNDTKMNKSYGAIINNQETHYNEIERLCVFGDSPQFEKSFTRLLVYQRHRIISSFFSEYIS